MAANQVAAGARALGDLDPVSIGSFYTAFFPLSIGYERMAKIAIQVDSKIRTGEFIAVNKMRDPKEIGHRIDKLFDLVEEISDRHGYDSSAQRADSDSATQQGPLRGRPADPIHVAIVAILTEFATTGRYYHLDALGPDSPRSVDAEQQWDAEVMPLLVAEHLTGRVKRKFCAQVDGMTSALDEAENDKEIAILAFKHDVSGATHTSLADSATRRLLYAHMNPWGRMYTLQLGRWLQNVLVGLTFDAMQSSDVREHVPYLPEFFTWLGYDDSTFRTRRNLLH